MRTLDEHNEWRDKVDANRPGALIKCNECGHEMVEAGPEVDGLTPVECPSCSATGSRQSHIEGKVRLIDNG